MDTLAGLVVHGHRDGHAPGGRAQISEECLARVRAAERATVRHAIGDVLLSGAGADGHPSEARQMADAWAGPNVHLWLDEHSVDSAQNVRQAYAWAQRIGATQLVVVSSWWHVRLAIYYRPLLRLGLPLRFVGTRRCAGVAGHLAHELRYLPEALGRSRTVGPETGPITLST